MKSNRISLYFLKKIESISPRQFIGVNLASFAFFSAVIMPQTQDAISTTEVLLQTQIASTATVPATNSLRWPLEIVSISQPYSLVHPGIDLRAPIETPIYPIADGIVAWTLALPWGYGKHVFIKHTDHITALYAHMSKVEVATGERVSKKQEIGKVGSTGWSTGAHLHLEIYQDNLPVNPLEVLPGLNPIN